ncbi:MAG: class I tRNA ligase family protein, partial [Ruminococcus sp.]|nr:class I tRNA ligase family protein [Ruminococcus sp.]
GDTAKSAQTVLVWVMKGMLKLLHPFMPYITEEIWQVLTDGESILMLEQAPMFDTALDFSKEETDFEKMIDAIKAVRNIRNEMNVVPSVKAKLYIETAEQDIFRQGVMFFERLASASEVEIGDKADMPDAVTAVTDCARIFIPLSDIVDTEKERARLEKEKQKVQKDIDFLSGKLSNEGFLAKAPEQLIAAQRDKLAKAQEKMAKIEESLAAL